MSVEHYKTRFVHSSTFTVMASLRLSFASTSIELPTEFDASKETEFEQCTRPCCNEPASGFASPRPAESGYNLLEYDPLEERRKENMPGARTRREFRAQQ